MSTDTVHTKKSPCGVTHNIFTSCSSTASVPSSSTVNASFIFKYSSCSRCSCSSFRRFSSASCQWPQTTTSSLIFIQITHKNCISSVLWWLCPPFTDLCPRYGNLGTLNKSKKNLHHVWIMRGSCLHQGSFVPLGNMALVIRDGLPCGFCFTSKNQVTSGQVQTPEIASLDS